MIKVAAALNSFASQEATAPPSEEIFVLTSGQLQDLILKAIEQATAPLEARLDALEERGVGPGEGGEEELQDLRERLQDLEDMTARERAFDRQRIARLERVDPQPLQRDRGEILRALIAANGGKMLAKEARQKMGISKSSFSQLLATMKDDLGVKGYHQDKRNLVLFIK
jgi:uncharacterized membrane protein